MNEPVLLGDAHLRRAVLHGGLGAVLANLLILEQEFGVLLLESGPQSC